MASTSAIAVSRAVRAAAVSSRARASSTAWVPTASAAFATGRVSGSSRRARRKSSSSALARSSSLASRSCPAMVALISSSYSASRARRRLARLVAPMYSGAALGRAPTCTPYVNWAFVLTAGTPRSPMSPLMSLVSATERSTAVTTAGATWSCSSGTSRPASVRPLTGADGIR